MRGLQRIAHVRWQDKRPNTEVLQICNISGIESLLVAAQFRWTGHVIRMSNDRLPKITFYSELKDGARSRGDQRMRYKDTSSHLISHLIFYSLKTVDKTQLCKKFIHMIYTQ